MEQNSIAGSLKLGFQNSIMFKVSIIGVVGLLLLIPTSYISDLIDERQLRREEVIMDISSKWGSEQIVAGPILSVPFLINRRNKDNEIIKTERHYAHFTPYSLNIKGDIDHELRKRSIYEVILYKSDLHIKGSFQRPDFKEININPDEILWQDAFLSLGISDLTGLDRRVNLQWSEKDQPFKPGLPVNDVFGNGIHSKVDLNDDENINFSLNLLLKGTHRLGFVPVGQETQAILESEWSSPSFNGDFLPGTRNYDEDGFNAQWNVIDLNRNLPDQWIGNSQNIYNSNFGVSMLIPVNGYQKNSRSSKYAILIISLTFLAFFLSEVIKKNPIHPFQYILAGFALVVFYILLLSMTEHIGFDFAYLISAVMTIALVVTYISAVIRNRTFTLILFGFFLIVYTFIYVILQLEDFSLLVGSIGLFAALALTMYLTRKIDWYSIGKSRKMKTAEI